MASMKDKLGDKLGDRMLSSIGANDVVPGEPKKVEGKYDGVKGLRDAKVIPLSKITADPDQPRKAFSDEAIDRLSESLQGRGLLQPIRVRWDEELGKWVIVAGERRFRAARRAGWSEIACVTVEAAMTESEILQDQLIENCLREDLSPIEQAQAFKSLMDANGWSMRRLADELHLSHPTISRAVSLLELPQEIQDQVKAGEIAPRTAAEIATIESPADQKEVAERVVKEKLTRDQVTGVVREKAGKPKKSRVELKLEDGSTVVILGPATEDVEAALKAALKKFRSQQAA
jgi:ParB family chromosome partitioning protein